MTTLSKNFFRRSEISAPATAAVTGHTHNRIYIPKAICLFSRHNYYDYFQEILDDLYLA
jgi:hypothetical protein